MPIETFFPTTPNPTSCTPPPSTTPSPTTTTPSPTTTVAPTTTTSAPTTTTVAPSGYRDLIIGASANPQAGRAPLTVVITGTANNPVNVWHWFINGVEQVETSQQITKVLTQKGVYSIMLRATDIFGQGEQVFAANPSTFYITVPNSVNITNDYNIRLRNDGGALPTGLLSGVNYYAVKKVGNSFQLSRTLEQTFASDFNTSLITVAFAINNNTAVRLRNSGGLGEHLPTGLVDSLVYYIVGQKDNSFMLSTTKGGLPLVFFDNGVGINFIQSIIDFSDSGTGTNYITKETFTTVSVINALSTFDTAIDPLDPRRIMGVYGSVDVSYDGSGIGSRAATYVSSFQNAGFTHANGPNIIFS